MGRMSCRLCPREDITARGLCKAHYQSEKSAGRLHLHPVKARTRMVKAVNGVCPPDHKHGATHTCYNAHGCRCTDCREAKSRVRNPYDWEDRRRRGRDVWVPAVGTMRRLQALAAIGWSCEQIAELIGSHYRPLQKIRAGERESVRMSTARRVAGVYERLSMLPRHDRAAKITRHTARKHRWLPPLAWDHIDTDRRARIARKTAA